jgi:hypothetical protein
MIPFEKLPVGEIKTCNWEIVVPQKICGKPALWKDTNGDRFYCQEHGNYIAKRFIRGDYKL